MATDSSKREFNPFLGYSYSRRLVELGRVVLLVGGLGSGLAVVPVLATTDIDPPAPIPAEALLPVAASPSGVESVPQSSAPASIQSPVEALPSASVSAPAQISERTVPNQLPASAPAPTGYNSVFIDPTDYSLGATAAPGASPNLVFAERATGCQITVAGSQTPPQSSCQATAPDSTSPPADSGDGIQVGPVSISSRGVSLGDTTIVSRAQLNEKLRPLNILRRGNQEYVFPLSIPAPITSLFGWRMHPVHQNWRFHSGTDLGSPAGTPVLATRSGKVAVADHLGGYGLMVILRHDDGDLESRYAHLSKLAVQAGEWVEQGEVVGLVGSTGTATGPNLHFEIRQLTSQGWAAADARDILDDGIADLLNVINNPLQALGSDFASGASAAESPANYPFRPAQPNAS
ncbi:peptidoglycan DD-metalloendopeptidase family protein [Nodosilinea sp. LEGE 07088]|uniref:M23 family metallopeptidase n=1 Tax=Nodosilinea sp. LEGE 07088 TaxID=2777968 RepID=UPI00187F05C1|nr:M23 family metallopeptidase [Nodosilinea sp. LEGE 07088]MBE9135628.1 peptidoglycan DD-metalloendopeptidase family protein [Nodosilinea sp. LEGE 07088]